MNHESLRSKTLAAARVFFIIAVTDTMVSPTEFQQNHYPQGPASCRKRRTVLMYVNRPSVGCDVLDAPSCNNNFLQGQASSTVRDLQQTTLCLHGPSRTPVPTYRGQTGRRGRRPLQLLVDYRQTHDTSTWVKTPKGVFQRSIVAAYPFNICSISLSFS